MTAGAPAPTETMARERSVHSVTSSAGPVECAVRSLLAGESAAPRANPGAAWALAGLAALAGRSCCWAAERVERWRLAYPRGRRLYPSRRARRCTRRPLPHRRHPPRPRACDRQTCPRGEDVATWRWVHATCLARRRPGKRARRAPLARAPAAARSRKTVLAARRAAFRLRPATRAARRPHRSGASGPGGALPRA
jgi:hypothetical protein